MKKLAIGIVIVVTCIILVLSFSLAGCKAQTTETTSAAETTVAETAAATTAAETATETTAAATEVNQEYPKYTFYVINHGSAGDQVWSILDNGAMRAAKDFGADVTIIYKGGDTAGQVAAIEAAIEAKPNGLAITIPDPVAFDEVTQKALDAGIPVIAFNIDGGKDNPRLAYIGADLTVDGYLLGLEMQQYFKKGDHVLIPAEFPGMYYAMARSAGVIKAMDAIGVTTEILDAGGMDAATTTSRIAAYMQGHPETKGIISVGGLTTDSSVIVVEDLGLQDKVVVGGSDIVTNTLRGLQNGIVKATIDQQLFLQTYYTIAELVMYNWGAFAPASINTSVGIVTPKDVDKLVPLINAQIR